ncbi:efflux RND transporter periplasmic adaptor subunit [Runella sp. SP2]|uniref:efflux RND transporter periplasmic adaptor subunit n=1 Tax=Runella sp. SP2 TaxID=2268026 RepID=UPI000F099FB6|nr:efflux RND transporter periplasmic adaptor subunit [Runella sp. SP2]AYQ34123.1 efflux RND transporter periplasmic adaptor subunit [Runella sp. SP2]
MNSLYNTFRLVSSSLLLSLLLISCNKKDETQQKTTETDEVLVPVSLTKVDQATRSESIVASGLVASSEEARLSFKIGGIIQKVYVTEGQKVSKGQLLASLNTTEIDAQVNQAKYGVEKSERDFKRVENMLKDTAATLEQMQNVTTALDIAKQNLQIAQFNRSYAQIISPIDGAVIKKMGNEGELTGPGTPIFYITSNRQGDWVVRVGVSDKDWARLKVGDKANVQLDAYPTEAFEGRITKLAPAADPMNKLYEIEVRIAPKGKRLATGLFAKVELKPVQSRSYTVVPLEAIVEGNGKEAFVYVLDETRKKVKRLPIQIGFVDGDKVLITNGLEGISEVITSGSAFLTESSTVIVK